MKRLLIACMIALGLTGLLTSSFAVDNAGMDSQIHLMDNTPEDVINQYKTNPDIEYTIYKQKVLKNFSGEPIYTIYELRPYGYAVLLNSTNGLLEACYSENANVPVDLSGDLDYYYGGLGLYCVQRSGEYYDLLRGIELDSEAISNANLMAANVQEYELQKAITMRSSMYSLRGNASAAAGSSTIIYGVGYDYFSSLIDYGLNTNGTCTVIAFQMLLGYYDYFTNDSFVDSGYESGIGTSEAFHQLLNSYVYGTEDQGGIFIHIAAEGVNSYLRNQGINCEVGYTDATIPSEAINMVLSQLQSGHPVIASMSSRQGALVDHTVLVYRATFNSADPTGTAVFTFNMGWRAGTMNGYPLTEYVATAGWFYECGYLESTCDSCMMTAWRDVDTIYHERNCIYCHYVETGMHRDTWNDRTNNCTACGRSGLIGGGITIMKDDACFLEGKQ